MENVNRDYSYRSAEPTWSTSYLWPHLKRILQAENFTDRQVFEMGCGNGATANLLHEMGFCVTAVDPSDSGIRIAADNFPEMAFAVRSAYDDLANEFGSFPCVVSLEVIEHCFWPRKFAKSIFDLIRPGGLAIISTPYHGYLKNLSIALIDGFDSHWSPLWDGGHIKFWSVKTLRQLLIETGFRSVEFVRAGRIPPLAKSMIAIARK